MNALHVRVHRSYRPIEPYDGGTSISELHDVVHSCGQTLSSWALGEQFVATSPDSFAQQS